MVSLYYSCLCILTKPWCIGLIVSLVSLFLAAALLHVFVFVNVSKLPTRQPNWDKYLISRCSKISTLSFGYQAPWLVLWDSLCLISFCPVSILLGVHPMQISSLHCCQHTFLTLGCPPRTALQSLLCYQQPILLVVSRLGKKTWNNLDGSQIAHISCS